MFLDGPKYAYKHVKLRKSCSFGNWPSSNGREYFLIATLQIYCNLSRWEGQKQRGGLSIKHHKLAQKYKIINIELYKEKHVALLKIARLLATTRAMATRTLQICILNNEKPWLSFARAVFIGVHFATALVLSTTWNVPFCSYVDDYYYMDLIIVVVIIIVIFMNILLNS